ncbi:precorrin-6A/cobalt-precorrin-6A reductase, partial [Inquilinus sp. CA228]|uniref:precorrin-6A/cobalt-precorrin-6A reductase n=1 Tax=Inquilinus sp. CA228 TaxID=3455609 RepID=UPI003F8D3526
MAGRRLLILGGTGEAAALARALAEAGEWEVTTSLAGRTREPAALPGAARIGGFGGADGLAAYLRDERIDRVVDA